MTWDKALAKKRFIKLIKYLSTRDTDWWAKMIQNVVLIVVAYMILMIVLRSMT